LFVKTKSGDSSPQEITFAGALPHIECAADEPRLELGGSFWVDYQEIKNIKDKTSFAANAVSLENKAYNKLQVIRNNQNEAYQPYQYFICDLLEDITDYKTLPDFTLRRLANLKPDDVKQVSAELKALSKELGDNYLEDIRKRAQLINREVIVAVENQSKEA
jgi:hypothetical protein